MSSRLVFAQPCSMPQCIITAGLLPAPEGPCPGCDSHGRGGYVPPVCGRCAPACPLVVTLSSTHSATWAKNGNSISMFSWACTYHNHAVECPEKVGISNFSLNRAYKAWWHAFNILCHYMTNQMTKTLRPMNPKMTMRQPKVQKKPWWIHQYIYTEEPYCIIECKELGNESKRNFQGHLTEALWANQ